MHIPKIGVGTNYNKLNVNNTPNYSNPNFGHLVKKPSERAAMNALSRFLPNRAKNFGELMLKYTTSVRDKISDKMREKTLRKAIREGKILNILDKLKILGLLGKFDMLKKLDNPSSLQTNPTKPVIPLRKAISGIG